MYRTKTCGELNINNAGEKVELAVGTKKEKPRRMDLLI